ncbi:MAG: hypothetical protein U0939_26965 [Pirellulales bacterium]
MARFSDDKWRDVRHEACKGCGVADALADVNKYCGAQGLHAEPDVDEKRMQKAATAVSDMLKALGKAEKKLNGIKKPSSDDKTKIKKTQELIDAWRLELQKDLATLEGYEEEFNNIPKWVKKRTDFVARLEKFAKTYKSLVEEQFKTLKRLPTYLEILEDPEVDEKTKNDRFGVLEMEAEDIVKRFAMEKQGWDTFISKDYDAERLEGGSLANSGINSQAARTAAKKEGTGLWSKAEKARVQIEGEFVEFAKAVKEAQQQLSLGKSYMLKGEARVEMQVQSAAKSLKTISDALVAIEKVYNTGAKYPSLLNEEAEYTIGVWKSKPQMIDPQLGKHLDYRNKMLSIVSLIENEYKRINALVKHGERAGSKELEQLMEQIDEQYELRLEKQKFYDLGYDEYVRRLNEAKKQAGN